jgi:hypothetical protein
MLRRAVCRGGSIGAGCGCQGPTTFVAVAGLRPVSDATARPRRKFARFAAVSPKVMQQFHNVIRRSGIRAERALEVGGVMGDKSLQRFPEPVS